MHFDILVEDASGEIMLNSLLENMLDTQDTYKLYKYKGVGHLPKNLTNTNNPATKVLLNQLPNLINGFGKTHQGYGTHYHAAVIVIFDLDDKNLSELISQLETILNACSYKPRTRFCIAIEEGEAWLLGDMPAIQKAYPHAKTQILNRYVNDSICGTWELLADAIYPGGSSNLIQKGYPLIGETKCEWARQITPFMNVNSNLSDSFNAFCETIKALKADGANA